MARPAKDPVATARYFMHHAYSSDSETFLQLWQSTNIGAKHSRSIADGTMPCLPKSSELPLHGGRLLASAIPSCHLPSPHPGGGRTIIVPQHPAPLDRPASLAL